MEPGIFGLGSRSFTQGTAQISVAKVGVGAGLGGPQEELGGGCCLHDPVSRRLIRDKRSCCFYYEVKTLGGGVMGVL